MKVFISGGCKNGKSYYAQHLAKRQQNDKLYYIATMSSVDSEDDQRIARHQDEREGWGFETIEQAVNIEDILNVCDSTGSFLLDSVTALLANEMFKSDGSVDFDASSRIIDGINVLLEKVENIVIVSDYIYSDAMEYDELTEQYRKALAQIDRATVKMCDVVLEVAYSTVTLHRSTEDGRWESLSEGLR
ncbi:MAG: bifunctional adenosylcobinamide kinase/adenosylcobinamide-phosphate guanylyltransferase [Oscillospiraceae bacterium]|nr:bifunctional adenosylcobinamide kinase/adenosylcobinamide-phosphate guanylyltransferase [Oscillospiraceae bacterium]